MLETRYFISPFALCFIFILHNAFPTSAQSCGSNDFTYSEFVMDSSYSKHWWLSDDVALVLSTKHTLYRTNDRGLSWHQEASKLPDNTYGVADVFVFNSTTFIVGRGGGLWATLDDGDTYTSVAVDAPEFVRFHMDPSNSKNLLGAAHDDDAGHTATYVSTDGGNRWSTLETYTLMEMWGPKGDVLLHTWVSKDGAQSSLDKRSAILGLKSTSGGDSTLVPLVQQVAEFGRIGDANALWVVQYVKDANSAFGGVELLTSDAGLYEFHAATFDAPAIGNEAFIDYTMADHSQSNIFINIQHSPSSGTLYVSDDTYEHLVPSLEKNYRNDTTTEVTRVDGPVGVYIANAALDAHHTVSYITWNAGGRWQRITAPKGECTQRDQLESQTQCSLHFYGSVSQVYQPVQSQASGVGILIGVGVVGDNLIRNAYSENAVRTFMSRDGGVTWTVASSGSPLSSMGDHGGLLVLAEPKDGVLQYTLDQGLSFKQCRYHEGSMELHRLIPTGRDSSVGSDVTFIGLASDVSFDASDVTRSSRNVEMSPSAMADVAGLNDIDALEADLARITVPRRSNSTGNDEVRAYLVDRLESLGWSVELDEFVAEVPAPWGDWRFVNVLATRFPLDYSKHQRRVVIAAHYDSLWLKNDPNATMATDSAASCAIMLDMARTLTPMLQDPDASTIVQLIFFDGEEAVERWSNTDSLYGSTHLARVWDDKDRIDDVEMFVLLDLIGAPRPSFWSYWPKTLPTYHRMKEIESALNTAMLFNDDENHPYFKGTSHGVAIEDDHLPFLQLGVPVVHLIAYPFPDVWHTSNDNLDRIDRNSLLDLAAILRIWLLETITPAKQTLLHFDFSPSFSRTCTSNDFEQWKLSSGYSGGSESDCVLGQSITFERRKQEEICLVGRSWQRSQVVKRCACTHDDYLCDECYDRTAHQDGSTRCVLRNGCAPPTRPDDCPTGYVWNKTQGYLAIGGNQCDASKGVDLLPTVEECSVLLGTIKNNANGILFGVAVIIVGLFFAGALGSFVVYRKYSDSIKAFVIHHKQRMSGPRDPFEVDDL